MIRLIFITACLLLSGNVGLNYDKYVVYSKDSELSILGTSSLHDWEMKGENFVSAYSADIQENELKTINSVFFAVPVRSLKSEEGKIMDNKAYDALKAEKYSLIKFTGDKLISLQSDNNTFNGVIEGNLFLAGLSKKIDVKFTGEIKDGYILINGSKKIKMSDYKITPPTAMLGALKTGNDIVIKFKLKFVEKA